MLDLSQVKPTFFTHTNILSILAYVLGSFITASSIMGVESHIISLGAYTFLDLDFSSNK